MFADELAAGHLRPSAIRNTLDPLRAIFRYAIRRDEITFNAIADLDVPQARGKRERIASADEAKALLDALPIDDRDLWATAFYAGLRRGELHALRSQTWRWERLRFVSSGPGTR